MNTTQTGKNAENRVASFLRKQKFKILDQNWRNRWCEIDIVAMKEEIIYFIEVKYRQSNNWGDGLDAITQKKLIRMSHAAEAWVSSNHWIGGYEMMVASVDDMSINLVPV